MTIFYCLRFEIHQPGGPGPSIRIPQEQSGPVISPVTRFPLTVPHIQAIQAVQLRMLVNHGDEVTVIFLGIYWLGN
jgi:hypothetical protein